jgi:carboxymethylenebutenolidase
MKESLFVFTLLIIFNSTSFSQTCCKLNPTVAFAKLVDDPKFKSKHESPLELNEIHHAGDMIRLNIDKANEGKAYFVKAKSNSKKYLLVFHEWWGLNDYIKNEADRLSAELKDVNVIAIDLYDGKVATNPDEAGKLMQGVINDRAKAIVNSGIEYCGNDAKIATIGWCFGGGWSMQAAILTDKKLKACVMYYGMPETDVEKLKNLNSEVLMIWAKKDQWINEKVVNEFKQNMKDANKKLTIEGFDAEHAFANPSNPKFDNKSAKNANKKAMAFLKSKLK